MRDRQRRHERRRGRGAASGIDAKTIVVLLLAVGLFSGLLYFRSTAEKELAQNDQQTFCKVGGVDQETVVLIDHTDNFNTVQQSRLKELLMSVALSIPKNSKIEVFNVKPVADQLLSPVFSLCNPGDGSDVNGLTGNKGFAKKAFENKFKKELEKTLSEVFTGVTANFSPIMESLQSVNVSTFLGDAKSAPAKKLIIVSDLLQYTKGFSLYKGAPSFEGFKRGEYFKSIRSDLGDVHVDIYFLRRDGEGAIQNDALRDFWFKFLKEQGAYVQDFKPIEG